MMYNGKPYENRAEIKRDIRTVLGKDGDGPSVLGVLDMNQISAYIGMHRNRVKKFMSGYELSKFGNRKVFTIDDVADRILRDRETVL
ncbi:MAG: hypothetical protein LBS24_04500 [Clostridiales Family XIII bacterium]|jgi:hypothetical protein|nr:hypothetical protein [Clostridiales Family XIII bacterium]